jgi:acyl-coenzyme A thioesterase PaaI-like protein
MSIPTQPQSGADVIAQFIPQSPFVAKLGIVADVLEADEVRLRLPWDPSNVTIGDMVHGGAIAALADVAVMAAAWAGADVRDSLARRDHVDVDAISRAGPGDRPDRDRPGTAPRQDTSEL